MDKIHDYIIRLKLDSKAVKKGINKEINAAIKEETTAVKNAEKVKKAVGDKEEARLRKELALLKSKVALEKTVARARNAGLSVGGLDPLKTSNRKIDLDTAEFKLRQKVLATEERIAEAKRKSIAAAKEAERVARITAREQAAAARAARGGFQNSQRFANMQQGIGDARSALRRSGGDPMLEMKLSSLSSSMKTAKTKEEIAKLSAAYRDVSKQVRQFTRDQAKLNKEMTLGAKAGNKLAATITRAGLQLASFYAIMEGAKTVFNVGKEFESMEAGLLAASNSSKEAKENFEFLRKTSMNLGRDITSGAKGFNRIAAAMKKDFSTEEVRATFEGIQEASATYALNKESSDRVLVAMGQIAAKGKFMREEFQNQLGDSLSIGWEALERATGIGRKELGKMMEKGELSTKKYMIPFVNALREIVRENDALEKSTQKVGAQQQRFLNVLKLTVRELFNSGGADSLSNMFRVLTKTAEYLKPVLIDVGYIVGDVINMVFSAGEAVGSLLSAITSGDKSSLGFWDLLNRTFALLSFSIWEAIAGIHLLSDILDSSKIGTYLSEIMGAHGSDYDFKPTSLTDTFNQAAYGSVTKPDSTKTNTTTVNVAEMKVEANDVTEFKNSFLTDVGM